MTTTQIVLYAALAVIILIYLRRFLLTRSVTRYSPAQLADRLKQGGLVLLDVRTAAEHQTGHIKGSLHIPVQEITRRKEELLKHKDREIVCYCQTGSRSLFAAARLNRDGYSASHLEGGLVEWNFAHHTKGTKR